MPPSDKYWDPGSALATMWKNPSWNGLSRNRRLELCTANLIVDHVNYETNACFLVHEDQLQPGDPPEDAQGVDLTAKWVDPGTLQLAKDKVLRVQVKCIHIERVIDRWRQYVSEASEKATGAESIQRHVEDEAQLENVFQREVAKVAQKDYRDALVVFYVDCETASQSAVDSLLVSNADLVRSIKAQEVWFVQDVPISVPHGSQPRCHVFRMHRSHPNSVTQYYHFTE